MPSGPRENEMKQYIQTLQDELEKRSNEAVAIAAKLRHFESPSTQQQGRDTEPKYKGKTF